MPYSDDEIKAVLAIIEQELRNPDVTTRIDVAVRVGHEEYRGTGAKAPFVQMRGNSTKTISILVNGGALIRKIDGRFVRP